jgi:hypothetical protein
MSARIGWGEMSFDENTYNKKPSDPAANLFDDADDSDDQQIANPEYSAIRCGASRTASWRRWRPVLFRRWRRKRPFPNRRPIRCT